MPPLRKVEAQRQTTADEIELEREQVPIRILNQPVDSLSRIIILNHMVEHNLDQTFTALSDPTRRGMLAALATGEKAVSELAAPYNMTLAGAAKHVAVLARADLIERRKVGRQQLCRLKIDRLKEANDWLAQWEQFWSARLDALEEVLKEDKHGR